MTSDAVLFRLDAPGLGYAGQTVLHGVNLTISAGEKVAVLGESGAGKTTLLRQLRATRPNEVAWCPQQPGLVPMLSVFHNIYMGRLDRFPFWYNLINLIYPLARQREEITPLVQTLGLHEKLFTSVDRLSGGQQSRTNLGRALYQQRAIFIGDEPVAAVDEVQADTLLSLICAQHETVVVALHDVELALRHCTRLVGLREGRVVLNQTRAGVDVDTLMSLYTG